MSQYQYVEEAISKEKASVQALNDAKQKKMSFSNKGSSFLSREVKLLFKQLIRKNMIHEVKIPTGCKASVSVDNEKIVVLIDPVEDFVTIDVDTNSIRNEIVVPKNEFNADSNFQKQMNGNITITGYEADRLSGALCDEDGRIFTKIHPGMVVKAETGHIALVGSSDCTVVLTPNKEIQLNQTCNFPFEYHATKEESDELFEQLKMQKALEVSDYGTLVHWWPNENDSYDVIEFFMGHHQHLLTKAQR